MFENSWEGSSDSVPPCGSTDLNRKPPSLQETIQKVVRTTQHKMQTQHTDENSFRKHGCFCRPVLLGLHLLFFFHLIHFFPLFHLSFNSLLSFFEPFYLFLCLFLSSLLSQILTFSTSCLPVKSHTRWESWMTEASLILLLLIH